MAQAVAVKVAISADFLKAFMRIPARQQAKVREFVEQFRANPTAASINYEKIRQARDPNVRSVRIDEAYRGIVVAPERGNVYVLVWVDHHDEAYRWAEQKVFAVHAETGSLQVLDVDVVAQAAAVADEAPVATGLFSAYRDRELCRVGVPEVLLPLVRSIDSEAKLDEVAAFVPQEAAEALYMLASGFSLQEVAEILLQRAVPEEVDVSDIGAALELPDSMRRFRVVADAEELAAMLNAPFAQWRVFLHPSQRSIVEMDARGPVRVLGGAGTGKTVVAMHRAVRLATEVFTGASDRILVTTFTKNLAADIRANLELLASRSVLQRIEVINLDAWVHQFLREQKMPASVMFDGESREVWNRVMAVAPSEPDLPQSFYMEEWREVVQAHGVQGLDAYLTVSRAGRGRSITRAMRRAIWPVFEEYRAELRRLGKKELVDCMRDARILLESKGDILPYRAIVVDEAQDMGMEAFRLLRAMIVRERGERDGNDLFIVGDAHQRIYGRRVVLGRCGIEIRGRSRTLRVNYRTTEETRRWAVGILEGREFDDLDDGVDEQKGYRSLLHGMQPEVQVHASFADEVRAIRERVRVLLGEVPAHAVCLVARTHALVQQYEGALRADGIETCMVEADVADDHGRAGVRLATMHRVKGLEFEYVIIAGAGEEMLPLRSLVERAEGEAEREAVERAERSLLYVAATRARRALLITCSGAPSAYVQTGARTSSSAPH